MAIGGSKRFEYSTEFWRRPQKRELIRSNLNTRIRDLKSLGPTGVGDVLVNRELEGKVIGLIVERAHLQKSSRGLMGMTLLGEPHTIPVEEYQSFGESAFRLKLEKDSRRRT